MQLARFLLVFAVATALAGCAVSQETVGSIAARSVTQGSVDAATAARLISQYRAGHGLPPVRVEPRLTRIASDHARRMAAADELEHVLPGEGSFIQRINVGGYEPSTAAENIAAGQKTLDDALLAWKKSPPHNANLLDPGVSEMGIAVYNVAESKYHTYWALVLASPGGQSAGAAGGGLSPVFGRTPFRGGLTIRPFGFLNR
jgi:uncharacterized protein YkwD